MKRSKTHVCDWCHRRRPTNLLEWNHGAEVWTCLDFEECDRNRR